MKHIAEILRNLSASHITPEARDTLANAIERRELTTDGKVRITPQEGDVKVPEPNPHDPDAYLS